MLERPSVTPATALRLWLLLVAIAVGLGYPTLRRYDPRDPRTNFDGVTRLYHWQVTGDAAEGRFPPSRLHYRYRVLVPALGTPFYRLAQGHVGTWDAGYVGFLVSASLFAASTALLVALIAGELFGDAFAGVVPALLYLLTFAVPNFHLAGLVDSGEACALMALVWALHRRRMGLLPVIGAVGVLAKETFLVFSVALATGWIATASGRPSFDRDTLRRYWPVVGLAAAGLATLTVIFSVNNAVVIWPWQFGRSGVGFELPVWQRAARLSRDLGLVYIFGWLAPLGLCGVARLPRAWIGGVAFAATSALALGLYNGEPGLARSLFNIAGPLLTCGSAIAIRRWIGGTTGTAHVTG